MRACDTLLPALATEFSVTLGQAARTIFVFAIAYGIFQLFVAPLGDRYGKLRIIALCSLACVIANSMVLIAPDLDWLVTARILSGACAGAIVPLSMAWIGDNVSYEKRQPELAKLLSACVMGMLAGQWLTGLIAQAIGWRIAFLLIAALFLAAGSLLLQAARRSTSPAVATASSLRVYRTILALPAARWILTITAIEGALAFGAMAFIPSSLQRNHNVSLAMAGGIAAFYGIGGLLYTRLAGRLLKRTGESGLALLGGLCLLTGFVLFVYAPTFAWTPAACALAGFGFYSLHNTLQTQATQLTPATRGACMSLFSSVLFLGQSLGVMGAAWVADHLADTLIYTTAGGGLLVLSLVVAQRFRHRVTA